MSPFLSLCIPTHQRKELLGELLGTIFPQMTSEVEIVISDNGSADGTKEYIQNLNSKAIFYFKYEKVVPCGENLMNVVSLAKGEYCWLISDDDILEPGAIDTLIDFLKKYPSLAGCSVNVEGYNKSLTKKKKVFNEPKIKMETVFSDKERAFLDLGTWIGFWSAQIIKRELWEKSILDSAYLMFEGYHHYYIISSIITRSNCFGYIQKKLVGYRADNESFAYEYGRVRRFAIDAKAYSQIPKIFFSPKVSSVIKKKAIKELLFWQLIRAKCEGLSYRSIYQIFKVGCYYFHDQLFFWMLLVPLLLIPKKLLLIIRKIYQKVKK